MYHLMLMTAGVTHFPIGLHGRCTPFEMFAHCIYVLLLDMHMVQAYNHHVTKAPACGMPELCWTF